MCVDLSLGFLFCSIDLYFCLCASTILSWWQWLWFLLTVLDIMVIGIKLLIPVHFCSLIPKILMFTVAISCLTPSNLPWFMDLIFQVPMQYCSLQHQILPPSPVTSTTGHCFCFGSVSSFFSGVISPLFSNSILGTYWPGELIFPCHIFLLFHTAISQSYSITPSKQKVFLEWLFCSIVVSIKC